MAPLPSGIVAFLMTDVEASSEAWNASALAAEQAIAQLDAAVARIAGDHGGSVVKARGEGDSHFVVFPRASAAVAAAAALQRGSGSPLSVRACVFVAEADPRDGDYLGAAVNHGARIRSVAHGGQVVVTAAVASLVAGLLPSDLSLRPLGSHRLRDVPDPVALLQVVGPGLRSSFPPLRTEAHAASAVMAVVAVDEVHASRRKAWRDDEQLWAWQRGLIHGLRDLADVHDGRYLKLLGDGCLVAFEDPRAAVAFAGGVTELGPFRVGVAVGLVEVVEGELVGRNVIEAHRLMRTVGAGEVRCCSVTEALCQMRSGPTGSPSPVAPGPRA